MKCPKCLTDNPTDSKFCKECATPLPVSREIAAPQTETLKTPIKELATGSIFSNRYQIIEELGKGGMGKVYKVFDTEIKEKVALKLLKPEVAADSETIERFRNELKFARKIRQANVCQMFDLARDEGSYYITMEYVQGEDLKRLIRKMGRLSAGQAVSIGKQVCAGLAEAHRLGVVHRDLKPQNIMVDEDGNARIMDFGIARSVKAKAITGVGVMIGTPEYMSPEQVEGKEADQRSDIYSLGIVLYEMVTGRVPFEGDTPFTIGIKHKSEMPKNPRELNAQIPEDLGRLILKCMAKEKEKRYQSASDLAAELTRIEKELPTTEKLVSRRKAKTEKAPSVRRRRYALYGAVVVLALLIVVAGIFLFRGRGKAISSIAVMPFGYAGGGAEMEYLAEGMTESIISNLSQLPGLKKVIARSSVFHYKGKEIVPKDVGQELGVDAVLISRMNQRGDELTINVELVNTTDNTRIWGDQYKKKVGEVFDFQQEISNSIAENLKLKLTGEEIKRIGKRYTVSPEAYQAYVRGRFFWNKRTEEGLKTAIEYFNQAIDKDPNYALAYAGLADTYAILPQYSSVPPKDAFEKATAAVAKALQLDDTIVEAHTALAETKVFWSWDWEGGRKEFKRAIELNPSYATAHHWYAFLLMFLGEFDESIEQITQAQELDPLSLIITANMGLMRFYARRYDEAIEYDKKTIEMDPNFGEIHWYLGMAYCQKRRYEEAIQELQRAAALSGQFAKHYATLGYAYVLAGKKDEAVRIVEELKKKGQDRYYAASVYAVLGDKDRAFECLDESFKERSDDIPYLKVDPILDSLRPDPRFKALLKKANLE